MPKNLTVTRLHQGNTLWELRLTCCRKANCNKCPHGPYWYYTISLANGRRIRKYHGKEPPLEIARALASLQDQPGGDFHTEEDAQHG